MEKVYKYYIIYINLTDKWGILLRARVIVNNRSVYNFKNP